MKKTLIASALALISINSFADTSIPDVKGQMKVTANVAAGCEMSAANINFGVLAMPIADVSASADINLTCSKGANLSIAVHYDGKAGTSLTMTRNLYRPQGNGPEYDVYDENGNFFGVVACGNLSNYAGYISFSENLAEIYGYDYSKGDYNHWQPDTKGICTNQVPAEPSLFFGGKGVMIGQNAGENIVFSLEVPQEPSKVWNNSNKYNFVATGDEQLIPMKANIKTAENPTHRMTPDTYSSTLNVVLSY